MRAHPATLVLATVLLAACERDGPVALLSPLEASMEIADASRDPGRVHFYFLPPMAAQPAPAGTFDASILPLVAVEVCELAGAGCGAQVARFTAEGRGLDRVTTSEFFEHYLALWRTDGPNVSAGKIYRPTVKVSGTLGYADVKVVRTFTEARSVDRTQYAVALKGLPLPIRFRIETGAVFPIGAAGGTVTAFRGAVEVDFAANAVSSEVGITVAPATNLPADAPAPIAGTAFDFGPDGATFAARVTLSIRYPEGTPNEADLRLHKLVGSAWVEVAGSTVDITANKARGEISGFSEFAVLPARSDPAAGLVGDIAFMSGSNVFLVKADGSNLTNLTNITEAWGGAFSPTWSPAGDKLAFSMSDPPDADDNIQDGDGMADYDIWVLDLSVTPHVLTRLAGNSEGDEWDPSWSPDGKKIAFVSDPHLFPAGGALGPSTSSTSPPASSSGSPRTKRTRRGGDRRTRNAAEAHLHLRRTHVS